MFNKNVTRDEEPQLQLTALIQSTQYFQDMIIEIKRVKFNYIIMIVREEKIIQQVKSRVLYVLYFILICGFTDTKFLF